MAWMAVDAYLPFLSAWTNSSSFSVRSSDNITMAKRSVGVDGVVTSLTPSAAARLREIDEQMEAISASLTALLEQAPSFSKTPSSTSPRDITEASLKNFRNKVARRIYHYGSLLKEHQQIWDEIPITSSDKHLVGDAHQRHLDCLQRFKTALSVWWRSTERQFHRLRLASLLENEPVPTSHTSRLLPPASADGIVDALLETKSAMESELERMKYSQAQLHKSSIVIQNVESLFGDFGARLDAAQSVLRHLKLRAEMDSQIVWWSFVFFLCVCGFIVLKRTSVLRTVIWIIGKFASTTLFCLHSFPSLSGSTTPSISSGDL